MNQYLHLFNTKNQKKNIKKIENIETQIYKEQKSKLLKKIHMDQYEECH